MNHRFNNLVDSLPTLLSNTRLDLKLEGWPAATTATAFFGALTFIASLFMKNRKRDD